MSKLSVTKMFRFSAAHHLPNHNGACKREHGHSYLLEVTVQGQPNRNRQSPELGMIIDFGNLKRIVMHEIIDELDHHNLNEVFTNPTAENMTVWIAEHLEQAGLDVSKVRLWEEMGSACCTWESHNDSCLERSGDDFLGIE